MTPPSTTTAAVAMPDRMDRFVVALRSGFNRYATWLVGISWKRFFLLSLLLLIGAAMLGNVPPFSWRIETSSPRVVAEKPKPPKPVAKPSRSAGDGVEIHIDHDGVRITRSKKKAEPGAAPAEPARPADPAHVAGETREEIKEALRDALESIEEAVTEEMEAEAVPRIKAGRSVRIGDYFPQFALLFILASAVIKIVNADRIVAERKAVTAEQVAESESLKRQVVEARMAAMQAQVEPHFLFNTLASIDHLIEVDPARASKMQKNLIALLRASMPAMRERATNLGRELEVVRPYLEILRVRMGDRLQTELGVGEGLYSAEFPSMMLQSLVENAIKHGLEPKAEGGLLAVRAEIVDGKLAVSVADTGVGFGAAATAGTGVGLANIRERLRLLYGNDAELRVSANPAGGTRAAITVPYRIANAGPAPA